MSKLINQKNVYLYFVSSNFEFVQLTNKCKIQHTGYYSMYWTNILVWDERQKKILEKFVKNKTNINILPVGPIPYLNKKNYDLKLKTKKNNLYLFDVQPYRLSKYLEIGWPNEYYLFNNVKKFYTDVLSQVNYKNTNVFYKRKRETNHIDKKYLNFLKRLEDENKISEIDINQNVFELFNKAQKIKVISMPFTGPSYVSNFFNKKTCFYDPRECFE